MTKALLVALALGMLGLVLLGIRRGWRNRLTRRSALPPLPEVPAEPGLPQLTGVGRYLGTAFAWSWDDRLVHGGLGSVCIADVSLYASGLLFARRGSTPLFVPATSYVEAWLGVGLGERAEDDDDDVLIVRWRLGSVEVDTGFRAIDKSSYPHWVRMINGKVNV
jgi:hypothetical protein